MLKRRVIIDVFDLQEDVTGETCGEIGLEIEFPRFEARSCPKLPSQLAPRSGLPGYGSPPSNKSLRITPYEAFGYIRIAT